MKKRIIIIGDSFSLGVGADFPNFDALNKYAPPFDTRWYQNWKIITKSYIENIQLQRTQGIKENPSIDERMRQLTSEYVEWQQSVYEIDFNDEFRKDVANQGKLPTTSDLDPGIKMHRSQLRDYEATWTNQLSKLLPDVEIINLSRGGSSMASVVSALSLFINSRNDHSEYQTLVFFQAPDPSRKHFMTTCPDKDYKTDSVFEDKLSAIYDYNIVGANNIKINNETYNWKEHNEAYALHNLSIGEWYQNVFNAQQICKANDFNMAWCTSAIPISDITSNLNNHYPNMLDFDIRLDRMPHNIDKKFLSLVALHRILGVENTDFSNIYAGCMHFTGEIQKIVANYMANSLISNENFWWQK